MAIAVNVQAGYPIGNISAEQATVTVRGQIAWSDLTAKLAELFPLPTTSGPGANKLDPLFGFFRCQSCEFLPVGADPTVVGGGATSVSAYDADFELPNYEFAWLNIVYSSVQVEFPNEGSTSDKPDGVTPVPGLLHQLNAGGEVVTLDQNSLVWSDEISVNGTNVSAHKVVPTIEHSVTWKRVSSPPWEAMRTLIGKVNDMDLGPFQTGTMTEETLLYLGFSASPDISASGVVVWDIVFRFSERRVDELTKASIGGANTADGVTGHESEYGGWNHFWKQEEEKVTDDVTGDAVDNPKTSGFRRLHSRKPAAAPLTYNESTAIFVKGSLETLFVQV